MIELQPAHLSFLSKLIILSSVLAQKVVVIYIYSRNNIPSYT